MTAGQAKLTVVLVLALLALGTLGATEAQASGELQGLPGRATASDPSAGAGAAALDGGKTAPAPLLPQAVSLTCVLSEARIVGAVSGDVAELVAEVKGTSFVDEWVRTPLFRAPVAVTSFQVVRGTSGKVLLLRASTGSARPEALEGRSSEGYDLAVGKKGDFTVRVGLAAQVSREPGTRTVTLPGVAAAAVQAALTIPEVKAEFTVDPQAELKTDAAGPATTTVTLFGLTGRAYTLQWQVRAAAPTERALLFAEQASVVSLERGQVSLRVRVDYQVVGGSVSELVLALPADYEVTSVVGEGIRSWQLRPPAGTPGLRQAQPALSLSKGGAERATLTVSLTQPVTGTYHFELEARRSGGPLSGGDLSTKEHSMTVPSVQTVGAVREAGSLVVCAATGIRLVPQATVGLRQVTVSEVPGYSRAEGFPITLAYEFLEPTWQLTVLVGEVAARVSASVESRVDVQRDALLLAATVNYEIREAPVFDFRLRIPAGARVLEVSGANINTYTVEGDVLKVDLRSAAQGTYSLAVTLSQDVGKPEAVELPAVEALGVEREAGYVLVATRPDTQVEPLTVTGTSQIDPGELPGGLAKAGGGGLAFQYLRQPYSVVVSVGAVQPEVYTASQTVVTVGERGLEVATHVDYDIRKAGVFRLRLAFPEGLRLTENIQGPQVEDWRLDPQAHELLVNLRTRTLGAFALDVKAEASVSDLAKGVDVPVIIPLEVKRGTGYVALRADASYRLRTVQMTGINEMDVRQLPSAMQPEGARFALAYRFYQLPWSLRLAVEPIVPVLTAETFTLVSVGEALEQVTSRIDYTIQFAGASQFELKLPEGAANVDFIGDSIKQREELEEKGHWRVSLQSAREGTYTLLVTFERRMPDMGKLAYAGLTTLGTEREKGYVLLTPRANVEITPLTEEMQGVSLVDVKEIPDTFTAGLTVPVIWAFKYIAHPFALAVAVTRHTDVSVLVAVTESANLVTKLSGEGELLTDLLCFVRNNRQQFLRVGLPEKADVWEASVAGVPIRPGRGEGGDVLLPISGVAGPEEAFPVKLRYRTHTEKLGRWGTVTLEAPRLDVPVMRVRWQLILPKEYELVADHGDMERSREIVSQDSLLRAWERLSPSARRSVSVVNALQAAQEKQLQAQGGPAMRAVSMSTGPMVSEGRSYFFEKLLAMGKREGGSPTTIRSTYLRRALLLPVEVGICALVVALGLLLLRRSARTRLLVAFAVALSVSFLGSRGEEQYAELLGPAVWTAWVVAAALALHWLGNRLRWRRAPAPQEPAVAYPASPPGSAPPAPQ